MQERDGYLSNAKEKTRTEGRGVWAGLSMEENWNGEVVMCTSFTFAKLAWPVLSWINIL